MTASHQPESEPPGYFDAYGLTDAETAVMNLIYGPSALTIGEAAAWLGMPESDAVVLRRAALKFIGRSGPHGGSSGGFGGKHQT